MKILIGTAFAFFALLATSAFASSESDHAGRAVMERTSTARTLADFVALAPARAEFRKVATAQQTDPARNTYSGK